jgi:glycosyltransferase involved in cell wall biosynthesis
MIWSLIPAYNAESTIEYQVKETLKYVDKICVINDGSEDSTKDILRELKNVFPKRLVCLHNSHNLGKLESVKKGLRYVLKDPRTTLIICMDADLAHSPSEIPSFIAAKGIYDMIIGNRYSNRELDKHRRAIVTFISTLVKLITGYDLADPLCGFRLFSRTVGEFFAKRLSTHGYGLEIEELILAKFLKARVGQINLKKYVMSQQPFIKATEIMDNLNTVIFYSNKISIPKELVDKLSVISSSLKKRESFDFNITLNEKIYSLTFNYISSKDSYFVSIEVL